MKLVTRKHVTTKPGPTPSQWSQDITWSNGYDPEQEICFSCVKRLSNGKFKPIVYALKSSPDGGLYWASLRLGEARRIKTTAEHNARQLARKFGCNFEEQEINSPKDIVQEELDPNVELLGRITLLWERAKRKF